MDEHVQVFVVHMTALLTIAIHPARKAQIALLVAKKVKISTKYSDFSDIFSKEKVLILPEPTKLNQHAMKLQESEQLPYRLIYSLGLIELETLKTYIKTNLVNDFIWLLKSLFSAFILFNRKPNGSLCLYVDYLDFYNLTIKNRYSLPLINELIDRLGQAKRFTELEFTSAYY